MFKKAIATLVVATSLASPAFAAPTIEEIVAQLEAQGFEVVSVRKTWLGRTRVEAYSETRSREIVFNARTGEILRDFWEDLDDDDDEDEGEDEAGDSPEDGGSEDAQEDEEDGPDAGDEEGDDEDDGGDDDTDDGGDDDDGDDDSDA